jgi:hypothetical protein
MPLYLLHFDRPLAHARHYLGWSASMVSLHKRVDHHYAGTSGARLMSALFKAGISFTLARTWEDGTKADERRMKQRGHARMCPICRELKGLAAETAILEGRS